MTQISEYFCCDINPINEISRVEFIGASKTKFPSKSVIVPSVVPFTTTVAPGNPSHLCQSPYHL